MRSIAALTLFLATAPAGALAQAAPRTPPAVPAPIPSVTLPPALDRVLRDYEKAWTGRDPAGLAALFTADGMTMSNGRPPRRGQAEIREGYANAGGALALRAMAFAADDSVAYIIGGYARQAGAPDEGKFVLALRRTPNGPWRIAADIDNGNQPPRMGPPAAPPPVTP